MEELIKEELKKKMIETLNAPLELTGEPKSIATIYTDAILNIPEMKEMMRKASLLSTVLSDDASTDTHIRTQARKVLSEFDVHGDSYGVPPLEEIVDKLVAKAEKYEGYKDIIEYWDGKEMPKCEAATIDDCPWCRELGQGKILEWKEKAEKWDALYNDPARTLLSDKNALDLIMSNLVVDERCKHEGIVDGKGIITRQARPEEVREFLDFALADCGDEPYDHELKSGGALRMKREGENVV